MIAINIKDKKLYDLIGQQKATPEEILRHLNSLDYFDSGQTGLSKRDNTEIIFGAYISDNRDWNKKMSEIFLREIDGRTQPDPNWESALDEMPHYLSGPFGRRRSGQECCFSFCYKKLEDWLEFIS